MGRNTDVNTNAPKLKFPRAWTPSGLRGALIIAAVAMLAYANSLSCPFLYDDLVGIERNPSITSLWPPWNVLRPPPDTLMRGRPTVNLTFAVNYAVSGLNVWSYHAANLLIHILAGLTLFGILRRTFLWPRLRTKYGRRITALALACALVWVVHPLQTQSVTYIKQRCESLMGLMFLLTLYCAIRGWQSRTPRRWHLLAAAAFIVGAGAKPTIVTAPFLVLLYDLCFVHDDPREALRRSPWLYTGFLVCLIVLGVGVVSGREWTQGPGWAEFTATEYALTQCCVIVHYLRLAIWPYPLCLDYVWQVASPAQALPCAVLLLAMAGLFAWALLKRRPLGYAGAWFFVILAPTSSVVPLPDAAFEHRMYLPLAGLIVLAVLGARAGFDRLAQRRGARAQHASAVPITLVIAVIMLFSVMTFMRNRDYSSALVMWGDIANKRPNNPRGRYNYGLRLAKSGNVSAALPHFQAVVQLDPRFPDAYYGLGCALAQMGRIREAIPALEQALRAKPTDEEARMYLEMLTRKLSSEAADAAGAQPHGSN